MAPDQIIENLIRQFCVEKLNEDYLKICMQVKEDYLELAPGRMNRGQPEIWAASIVWASGTVNFLADKTFLPYATLTDVCTFFKTNKSTVGNKAGQIREALEMDHFNERYLLEEASIPSLMRSMRLTEDGFIVFDHRIENFLNRMDAEKEAIEPENDEDDGQLKDHTLVGKSEKPILLKTFYQYEYALNQMVNAWIKNDGQKRTIVIGVEGGNELTVRVTCTKTEARKIEDWMRNHWLSVV